MPPWARTMPAARMLAPLPSVRGLDQHDALEAGLRENQAHQAPIVPPPTTTASADPRDPESVHDADARID